MAQRGEHPTLDLLDRVLDLRLVPGSADPRGDDGGAVVRRELAVGRVELGLIAVGRRDAGLEVVGHRDRRDALDVLERVDVRGDPRAQILSFTRLGIRKARRPERGDEDRRLGDRARLRIDDVDAAARVVDEELLAGTVLLAHDEIELTPPRAVEITEARVPVATLGMALAVLLPEQLERDRSEEHTSELQSQSNLVCRLLLEKKKK